jgi:hypothetical protein
VVGPFRIRYIPVSDGLAMTGPTTEAPPAFQAYLDRLMRMIPGEAVALYLIGAGLIPNTDQVMLASWSVVCLLGVITIRIYGTRDPDANLGPQWTSVIVSSLAFIVWLYSLGGPFAALGIHVPYVGSLLVLAWTFFVPFFYKGEAELAEKKP